MTPVHKLLPLLTAQAGDRYRFGAEVDLTDPDPDVWDCSELIQWACAFAGVRPTMPDGSWIQARHARKHRTLTGVGDAIDTPGALLFRFAGGSPFTGPRPRSSHVAVSLGDGRTIEARSASLGTNIFTGADRRTWTHAALIPGVDYTEPAEEDPWTLEMLPVAGLEFPTLELTDPRITGAAVGRLQSLLINAGSEPDGLVIEEGAKRTPFPDRVFGPGTRAAVAAFQESYGVNAPAPGVVGPETWFALLMFR